MPDVPPITTRELDAACARWALRTDGEPVRRRTSLLAPVRRDDGEAAFLKLTNEPDELVGMDALAVWGGHGAVRVLERWGSAILLERAGATLRELVPDDAEATRVLCDVGLRLHAAAPSEPRAFPPLRDRFESLVRDRTPRFDEPRRLAAELLDRPGPLVLLHGDLHHENVLDGGAHGWLAIDPQPALGPAAFDVANIFTNWSLADAVPNFDARLAIVTEAAGIHRRTLLEWIAAWSALSGIWHLEDGDIDEAELPHTATALALARLAAGA